jgi:hypothetical protein
MTMSVIDFARSDSGHELPMSPMYGRSAFWPAAVETRPAVQFQPYFGCAEAKL